MRVERIMPATAQFHSPSIRQTLEQSFLSRPAHQWVGITANHQHGLSNLCKDRPQIDPMEQQRPSCHRRNRRRPPALEKEPPEFRILLCERPKMTVLQNE